jgi:purine-cytosine permease-like protein
LRDERPDRDKCYIASFGSHRLAEGDAGKKNTCRHSKMKTSEERHFGILIFATFIGSLVMGIAGGVLNATTGVFAASNVWQIANMFYVVGCAMFSLKATGEGRNVSAAGFILLSIGMGTFFSLQTTITHDTEAAYVSGGLILIPGLWLSAYYNKFPVWLRVLSVVVSIPRIIMIANYYRHIPLQRNGTLDSLGYVLPTVTSVLWGLYAWKEERRK